MQLHYSIICLSSAVLTATALVPFPLSERQIGQACSTPVRTSIYPTVHPSISLRSALSELNLVTVPSLFSAFHTYKNICLLFCVCHDRMATAHVRTQPTAQPKVSTSQATAPALQTSNAASKKPATRGPALASV